MSKKLQFCAAILWIFMLTSCEAAYYLKVNDCHLSRVEKDYATVFTSLKFVVAQFEQHLIFDELHGELGINREDVSLYINGEYQEDSNFGFTTNQGVIRTNNIKISEGYLWIDFILGKSQLTENDEVKIIINDLEYCLTEDNCHQEDIEYSFIYTNKDERIKAKMFSGKTWWRNPNVEICTLEELN